MDNLEILKVVEEFKQEYNITNEDMKKIVELAKVMFGNKGEE